jgi:hypothetical protein
MPAELPTSLSYGFVVGRYLLAVADTTRDADRLPDPQPASGSIRLTPVATAIRTAVDGSPVIVPQRVTASIDAEGYLVDPTGERGVWLVTGAYDVTFSLGAVALPPFRIYVHPEHTPEAPLDLGAETPLVPAPFETFVVNQAVYVGALAARDEAVTSAATARESASSAAESASTATDRAGWASTAAAASAASADRASAASAATTAAADRTIAQTVTSGAVVVDDLVLTRTDGSTVTAGNVRGPKGNPGDQLAVTNLGNIGATINLSSGSFTTPRVLNGTLTANATLVLPTTPPQHSYVLILNLKQDATGGRTLTVPDAVLLPGGQAQPLLTTTPGALDQLIFEWTGADWIYKLGGAAIR